MQGLRGCLRTRGGLDCKRELGRVRDGDGRHGRRRRRRRFTGSVASIKAVELVRALTLVADVKVVATAAARHFFDVADLPLVGGLYKLSSAPPIA